MSYGYNVSVPARSITLYSGDTVYDVLKASGVSEKHTGSGMTTYVTAIEGLEQKKCGGGSGWTYEINGAQPIPNMGCGRYLPKDGDEIVWRYVLSP